MQAIPQALRNAVHLAVSQPIPTAAKPPLDEVPSNLWIEAHLLLEFHKRVLKSQLYAGLLSVQGLLYLGYARYVYGWSQWPTDLAWLAGTNAVVAVALLVLFLRRGHEMLLVCVGVLWLAWSWKAIGVAGRLWRVEWEGETVGMAVLCAGNAWWCSTVVVGWIMTKIQIALRQHRAAQCRAIMAEAERTSRRNPLARRNLVQLVMEPY